MTMLISSHDLNHIAELYNRIVVLEKGQIVKELSTKSNMLEELENYFAVY